MLSVKCTGLRGATSGVFSLIYLVPFPMPSTIDFPPILRLKLSINKLPSLCNSSLVICLYKTYELTNFFTS